MSRCTFSGIFMLLVGCSYQKIPATLNAPLYQNEKCYYAASSHQPKHRLTQVEKEIRYNRCRRN